MFETLDQVNWKDYRTFFGAPENLPDLLIQTQSSSRALQDEAWFDLTHAVCHQGSPINSALAIIPFLAEILRSPTSYGKEDAASLLAWMALSLPLTAGPLTPAEQLPEQQGAELTQEHQRQLLRQQLHKAIQPLVPLLYPYVRDPDGDGLIVLALLRFPDYAATTIPVFDEAMRRERDDDMRQLLQLAAIYLAGGEIKEEYRHFLGIFPD